MNVFMLINKDNAIEWNIKCFVALTFALLPKRYLPFVIYIYTKTFPLMNP